MAVAIIKKNSVISLSCREISHIKTLLYTAVSVFLILAGIVFLTPVPFTACSVGSLWCATAYFFTSSGGPIGFFIMLILTAIFYASSAQTFKDKALVFGKSLLAFILFFSVLAYVNEHYTKPILKSQRPSHLYMLNHTGLANTIDSLYQLDKKTRKQFFETLIKTHPSEFNTIDENIREHWVQEAGYSFPSGHTFNAFLFAVILSYAIYFNRSWPAGRRLFFLPFVWAMLVAISRVAVGAHTALDVTAGALLGMVLGFIFLYSDRTRHWLTRK